MNPNLRTLEDSYPPAGMLKLEQGDIVRLPDGMEVIVSQANDCRARVMPMAKVKVSRTTKGGEQVDFEAAKKPFDISTTVDRGTMLRRTGLKGLKDFLAAKTSRRVMKAPTDEATNETTETNGEEDMKKDQGKKSKKATTEAVARGGLTKATANVTRKDFIRSLYTPETEAAALTKAQIVDEVLKNYYPEDKREKNRGAVVGAVNNEASYMSADKLQPKWKQAERAPKPEKKARAKKGEKKSEAAAE